MTSLRSPRTRLAADGTTDPDICGTIVYVKGKGFFRQEWTKSNAGYRKVLFPRFAVGMLMTRKTYRCRQP